MTTLNNLDLDLLFELRCLYESNHDEFVRVVKSLPIDYQHEITKHWYFGTARLDQIIPFHQAWRQYIVKPGRGFGKNWMVSRNLKDLALRMPGLRINCFAMTADECNDVMIEGESGIEPALNEDGIELIRGTGRDWPPTPDKVIYLTTKSSIQLRFYNKSIIRFYSSRKTRGKQSHVTYADELFCWYEDEPNRRQDKLIRAYRELLTITRLKHPMLDNRSRLIITSTPQAVEILKMIYEKQKLRPDVIRIITGTTFDNPYLSEEYLADVMDMYGDTARGRQELYGQESWEIPGALWTWDMIQRVNCVPDDIQRVVVAVDPAVTNNAKSDESGISVVARDSKYNFYVLADRTLKGSTRSWVRAAIKAYNDFGANEIVYESNQGGDLVKDALETELKRLGVRCPIKDVHASKGKYSRAENEAMLYEQGRVFHVGRFDKLEDQMTSYNPEMVGRSPDRMDALVWALNRLRKKRNAFVQRF